MDEEIPMPKHYSFKDLRTKVYGRLTVIKYVGLVKGDCSWECRCDCGNPIPVIASTGNLNRGRNVCCGCTRQIKVFHGASKTPEYKTWITIKDRCYYKNNKEYKDYGGRGIRVCDRWLHSPDLFMSDMGPKPSPEHSIDRIDVNGDYTPENCRWATKQEQSNNRRDNVWIEFDGKKQTLKQWSEELGLNYAALQDRRQRGWSEERMLLTPIRKMKDKSEWKTRELN